MKKTKKAQIEVSFNWVFVLIAGAAILFFFIKVIGTEITITGEAEHSRATTRLNTIITITQQNIDSITTQPRMNFEIEFSCNEVDEHIFGVKGASRTQTLQHQLVFSPKTIGPSRQIAWVKQFQTPFPVSTMLYLTDEETKYIFLTDGDDGRMDYYHDLLPQEIHKEKILLHDFIALPDQGYKNYILIIDESEADINFGFGTNARLANKVSKIIVIKENENKIEFYELGNNNFLSLDTRKESSYFTEESIIGAIISGNPEIYACVMKKALQQLRMAANINEERADLIFAEYEGIPACESLYSIINRELFKDMATNATQGDPAHYEEMNNLYSQIQSLNNRIMRAGCTLLY